MSRWLVTGAGGMLGTDLAAALTGTRSSLWTTLSSTSPLTGRTRRDRGCPPGCRGQLRGLDRGRRGRGPGGRGIRVNAAGAANVASACAQWDAAMLQFSTDYVFDGSGHRSVPRGCATRADSAYGRTKAAGEWAVRACFRIVPGSSGRPGSMEQPARTSSGP